DKFEILSHVDGIIKNVYIIESLLVSHGDIIFDVYTKKDIRKLVSKDKTLGDTLRFSLTKAGYLEAEFEEENTSEVEDFDFSENTEEVENIEKEQTMRFKSISDSNQNNFHGDLKTDEQFTNLTEDFDDLSFANDKKDAKTEEITIEEIKTIKEDTKIADDATLGITIPTSLESLDDMTFSFADKKQQENDDLNDDELSFNEFKIPETSVVATERIVNEEKIMKQALANAIKMEDGLTVVLGED